MILMLRIIWLNFSFFTLQIGTAHYICPSAQLTPSNAVYIFGHEPYEVWYAKVFLLIPLHTDAVLFEKISLYMYL